MCCDAAVTVACRQQISPQSLQLLSIQLHWMSCMVGQIQDLAQLSDATCRALMRLPLMHDIVSRATGADWQLTGCTDAFSSAIERRLRTQPGLAPWMLVWLVVHCSRDHSAAAVDSLGRPIEEQELLKRCVTVHRVIMEQLFDPGRSSRSFEQLNDLVRGSVQPLLQAYESIVHDELVAHVDAMTGLGVVSTLSQLLSQFRMR